jgi:hypothetical protein
MTIPAVNPKPNPEKPSTVLTTPISDFTCKDLKKYMSSPSEASKLKDEKM